MAEIVVRIRPEVTDADFRLLVLGGITQRTVIRYHGNHQEGTLLVDVREAGTIFDDLFPAVYSATVQPSDDRILDLHVFVDWSSVETFAARGTAVFSTRMFPDTEHDQIRVEGSRVYVENFTVHKLKTVW